MDRETLKRTLHEQVVPLNEAVRQKIEYLLSDDVFAPTAETPQDVSADNMSFSDAFGVNTSSKASAPAPQKTPSPALQTQSAALAEKAASFAEHKQSMAEKIAALRGISNISANYSRHKN